MESIKPLIEADAALAFAKAWNLLDPAVFIKLLHPDGCYESQWVFDVLKGKKAIADYLIAKMATVRNSPNTVYAELGKISYLQCQPTLGEAGQDCVILAQGDKDEVKCVVTFEILDNQILIPTTNSGHFKKRVFSTKERYLHEHENEWQQSQLYPA